MKHRISKLKRSKISDIPTLLSLIMQVNDYNSVQICITVESEGTQKFFFTFFLSGHMAYLVAYE